MVLTNCKDTIADLEEKKSSVPTLAEFLQGRSLTATYSIVYGKFIPCISSSKVYKQEIRERLLDKNDNSELFSMSDEAFTLLLLENYFDRWMDIYTKEGGVPRRKIGSRRKKEVDSDVKPKYTSGGVVYNARKEAKGKGWKNDGIQRYNDLFGIVETDRANNELFMARFLASQRQNEDQFIQRRPSKKRTIVLPRCDLGLNFGQPLMAITPVLSGAASRSDGSDDGEAGYSSEEGQRAEV